MREILFRGKRTDNGEWETGFLIGRYDPIQKENIIKSAYIDNGTCFYSPVEVLPETVGQYTGLTDKNGKKIFEGDILKATFTIAGHENGCYAKGFVIYDGDGFKLRVTVSHNAKKHAEYTDKEQTAYYIVHNFAERNYSIKVIGNIHDNPELLTQDTL